MTESGESRCWRSRKRTRGKEGYLSESEMGLWWGEVTNTIWRADLSFSLTTCKIDGNILIASLTHVWGEAGKSSLLFLLGSLTCCFNSRDILLPVLTSQTCLDVPTHWRPRCHSGGRLIGLLNSGRPFSKHIQVYRVYSEWLHLLSATSNQ